MKKTISIILSISIFLIMFSMNGYAINEEEFNIEAYSWEDIMNMNSEEFMELLSDFERVYDPLGTYNTVHLTENLSNMNSEPEIQPMWTSGKTDISGNPKEIGTHELITAKACGILMEDKGFWGTDESGSIMIALTISLASILPDTDPLLGIGDAFKGHFYDPDTGKNWMGGSSNTAKTNAEKFYDKAIESYNNNDIDAEKFIKNVGKMLHYVQDACQPHHAANIVILEKGDVHTKFENYVNDKFDSLIVELTSVSNYSYQQALSQPIGTIVHEAAVTAKRFVDNVDDVNDQSDWPDVATSTVRNAIRETARVLYKLSVELSIPLN